MLSREELAARFAVAAYGDGREWNGTREDLAEYAVKMADALLAALAPVEAAPTESKGKVAREWTNADPSRSPVVTPTTKSPEDGENQRGEENSDPPPLDPDTHPLREEALAAWEKKYVRQAILSNTHPSNFKKFLQGYIAGHADARASGRLTPTPAPVAPPAGKYEPRVGDFVTWGSCTAMWRVLRVDSGGVYAVFAEKRNYTSEPRYLDPSECETLRLATPSELAAAGLAVPPPATAGEAKRDAERGYTDAQMAAHRAEFESWALALGMNTRRADSGPGYDSESTNGAWWVWEDRVPFSATPAPEAKRPTHVRVTRLAHSDRPATVGKVYKVVRWNYDGSPDVIGDNGSDLSLSKPDGSDEKVWPAWEPAPCPPPVAAERRGTFYLLSGALPPGLTLDTSGEIHGTPTASGHYSFRLGFREYGDATPPVAGSDVGIPRRIDISRQTPIEAAIRAARAAVEAGPAHPHMTRATTLLGQALDAVADFVDGVPEVRP